VTAPTEPAAPTALRLDRVTVTVGGRLLLDELSLTVPAGGWTAVVGPNGAGKTTALRAVAGLVGHRGQVSVRSGQGIVEALAARSPAVRARTVAYAPQDPVIPAGCTVGEYVLLGRTPHLGYLGRPGQRDRQVAEDTMDALSLADLADRDLVTLSGGERRRAVLARSLAQHAPVLLLDEPTSALDIGHAQHVLELVDELRRERGLTVLATLHDLTLAGQYADQLVLLVDGRVVAAGPPAAVLTEERLRAYYGARVAIEPMAGGRVSVRPVRPDPSVVPDPSVLPMDAVPRPVAG
jgi:iron complex transport system ATP-binding protein